MRVKDTLPRHRQVRPQRLHLRLQERPQDALRPRAVLAHQERRRRRRRTSSEGELADVKVKIQRPATRSTARPARCWSRSSAWRSDLSHVRLFHTSVTRAIAIVAELAGRARLHRQLRGLRGRAVPVLAGRRLRRARGRDRQRGDLHRAAAVLGDRVPPADQVRARQVQAGRRAGRLSGHRRDPAPVPRARHQEAARTARTTRRTTTSRSTARRTTASSSARRSSARPTRARTRRCGWRRSTCTTSDLNTFVSSDHGFAPQFAAIDASKVLVDLGLLSRRRRRTAATGGRSRRSARRRPAGPAARCRSTSTSPGATRRAGGPIQQVPADRGGGHGRQDPGRVRGPQGPQRLDRRRPARGLEGDRPHVHQGRGALHPERRQQHGRHGAPDADRRPRRVLVPAVPVRRGDPGTLIARSQFFGQHGYVPDVQDLKSNTNMRATFLAGGPEIERGKVRRRAQHRPRADRRVPARHPGAAAEPGHRAPRRAREAPATRRCRSSG